MKPKILERAYQAREQSAAGLIDMELSTRASSATGDSEFPTRIHRLVATLKTNLLWSEMIKSYR
jgi:hypothetical protein